MAAHQHAHGTGDIAQSMASHQHAAGNGDIAQGMAAHQHAHGNEEFVQSMPAHQHAHGTHDLAQSMAAHQHASAKVLLSNFIFCGTNAKSFLGTAPLLKVSQLVSEVTKPFILAKVIWKPRVGVGMHLALRPPKGPM